MEKLIFENLKLKEHIQQLKVKKDGDDFLQGQVEQSNKERDELASRVQTLEAQAALLSEQITSKDKEILHLNDCNDKLASGIINALSYMLQAFKTTSTEPSECTNLEEALEHYTMELSNELVMKDEHSKKFKKMANELIGVVKALEQALRLERIPVPRPPKVDESNIAEYLKQLVYIMQGVCASKGRVVAAREQPIIKREMTTEEVQRPNKKHNSGSTVPIKQVPVKSEDPSLCRVSKLRNESTVGYNSLECVLLI